MGGILDSMTHAGTTSAAVHSPRLLSLPDAQRYLGGLGRESLYRLIRSGDLTVTKIGARTFVDVAELDRFVDERQSAAVG